LGLRASGAKASSFVFDFCFLISRRVNLLRIVDSNVSVVRGCSEACAVTDGAASGIRGSGERGEEDVRVVLVADLLTHGGELFLEVSKVLKEGAHVVVLPTTGVPKTPHEIGYRRPSFLLVDLLQHIPDCFDSFKRLDTSESAGGNAGADDLLDGNLLLPPTLCGLQDTDLTKSGTGALGGESYSVCM
jgi:hypothetical protein